MSKTIPLFDLLQDVRGCQLCQDLPLGPNPVVQIGTDAKILIIGQAPGTRVHNTGIPWNDPSGDNLRRWMGIDRDLFYDPGCVAIMPMGFCYPGRGKSGDLPPRVECAPRWHSLLLEHLPNIEMTLLVGQYAQRYYLDDGYRTLTERVQHWRKFTAGGAWPLVHPSPRNRRWMAKNPWFEQDLIPDLQQHVERLLTTADKRV